MIFRYLRSLLEQCSSIHLTSNMTSNLHCNRILQILTRNKSSQKRYTRSHVTLVIRLTWFIRITKWERTTDNHNQGCVAACVKTAEKPGAGIGIQERNGWWQVSFEWQRKWIFCLTRRTKRTQLTHTHRDSTQPYYVSAPSIWRYIAKTLTETAEPSSEMR